ncbi:S1 family peptidase [Aquincola tertiaricarbonis]|uniref:S1 family peptidase n=1 Tax=Aquincola tertiaricarbonis TaxID=391953 RepID=UPI0006152805|nr:serine protease [Aquincola tertiaricarbonis]
MLRLLACVLAAATGLPAPAADTSFLDGPQLGGQLLRNVVQVRTAEAGGEHGFGLVVGSDGRHAYIATAAHVLQPAGAAVEVVFCDGTPAAAPQPAQRLAGFEAPDQDLAVLRTALPAGYVPLERVLAPAAGIAPRQEAWLLGQEGRCGLVARSGAVAVVPAASPASSAGAGAAGAPAGLLRIEFPGARGGSSGGPVMSGHGVLGLVTDADDLAFSVLPAAAVERSLRSLGVWRLQEARNIPPTDPRAAEVDLAETLNQYLFGVRNLQQLLLRPSVPRTRFVAFANEYNAAVNRFRDARERHDGALARHWPAPVLARWQALRDSLWSVHQVIWRMNAADSQAIFDAQASPPEVRARMQELEPALQRLQSDIEGFLQQLARKEPP